MEQLIHGVAFVVLVFMFWRFMMKQDSIGEGLINLLDEGWVLVRRVVVLYVFFAITQMLLRGALGI